MSRLTHIKLDNFTSFAGLDQSFSAGVNVIIGANGTGKTHLLKVLYAACAVTVGEDREKSFALKLRSVFNPYEGRMGRLARRQGDTAVAIAHFQAALKHQPNHLPSLNNLANALSSCESNVAGLRRHLRWRAVLPEAIWVELREGSGTLR